MMGHHTLITEWSSGQEHKVRGLSKVNGHICGFGDRGCEGHDLFSREGTGQGSISNGYLFEDGTVSSMYNCTLPHLVPTFGFDSPVDGSVMMMAE